MIANLFSKKPVTPAELLGETTPDETYEMTPQEFITVVKGHLADKGG